MGTLGHRNQLVSKPAGRKIAAKKQKTPGKFGKFARRAGLVAGIAIIAPSLLNAQGNIKTQVNKPADEQTQIMMAASGESTPENTYTVPDARPKTTEKPAPVVNKLGQTIIGEPFCDVRFEGDKIIFKNFAFTNEITEMSKEVHNETQGSFKKQATIVYLKERHTILVHCGYCLVHLRIEKDLSTGKWKDPYVSTFEADSLIANVIVPKDGSFAMFQVGNSMLVYQTGKDRPFSIDGRIFTHAGAIYEDAARGVFIATTPTELFVKTRENTITYNYIERGLRELQMPYFIEGKERNVIEMRDANLKTPAGKRVVMKIQVNNLDNLQFELDDILVGRR